MVVELRIGDSRKLIKEIPDKSIDCVMTSPPYWGLRDYGHPDQIGLEKTPEEYLKTMLDFFDDVKLKLKDEGNCFVNLGDTYAGSKVGNTNGVYADRVDEKKAYATTMSFKKEKGQLPSKCLCMIPQRFAWGMIERGWILRNEIGSMGMKLTEYIKRNAHLKADVPKTKRLPFRRWVEEYDKHWGLKPI